MFYSVFGGLSIYNKAYAKEQDRLKSLYKNRIEMEVVTGNGRNVVEHVDSGLSEGNLIIAGKLSLSPRTVECQLLLAHKTVRGCLRNEFSQVG